MIHIATDNNAFFAKVDLMLETPHETLAMVEGSRDEPWQLQRQFPKRCRCCGALYNSYPTYLDQTKPLGTETGVTYVPAVQTWVEYRNCMCGSTLVLLFNFERDFSPEGLKRRDYFWECVHKLRGKENLPMEKAIHTVRHVFRKAMEKA